MPDYSQPVYISRPPPPAQVSVSAPSQDRNHNQIIHTPMQSSIDESAIQPGLANLLPANPYQESPSEEMSQDQEHAFSLRLQAAAAAASQDHYAPSSHHDILSTHEDALKQRRLGRACDACSKRKVKCGEQIPCKHCIDIGIPCTFARPARRRGPTNKVAQELKRQRFDNNDLNTLTSPDYPPYLTIEAVAPIDVIHRLMFEFFTYVHPIFPFPHEHLTMDRLKKREDTLNKSFCAMIASLAAAVSAIFPRIAQDALGQHALHRPVVTDYVFIDRCLLVCQQSRGPVTSERDIDDATTSFFIGLVSYLRKLPGQLEVFATDALSIARHLGVERDGILMDGSLADTVTKEVGKRIYWAVYSLSRSLQQDYKIQDIMPPRRKAELPALPELVDDYYIYKDRIQPQPHGQLSTLEAFCIYSSIHNSYHSLLRFDLLDDEDRSSESTRAEEGSVLRNILQHLDGILDSAHPELASLPRPEVFAAQETVPGQQARMHIRWECQKIMLRSAVIRTRWFLVQRLEGVLSPSDNAVAEGRGKCLQDFAALMANLSKESLEPVGRLVVPSLQAIAREMRQCPEGIRSGEAALVIVLGRAAELFSGWDERVDIEGFGGLDVLG